MNPNASYPPPPYAPVPGTYPGGDLPPHPPPPYSFDPPPPPYSQSVGPPYGLSPFPAYATPQPSAPPQHLYPQLPPQDWQRIPSRPAPAPPSVGVRSPPGTGQPSIGFGHPGPQDYVDSAVKAPLPTASAPPPTGFPPTGIPPTGLPPTGFPPTGLPPTGFPPTGFPPSGLPPTGFPPTGLPPTGIPLAGVPATAHGSHPSYSPHPPFQDTLLGPHLQERWQCGGARLFLVQHDALVVAPSDEVFFKVYVNPEFDASKCPSRRGSVVVSPQGSSSPSGTMARSPPSGGAQQFSVLVEVPKACRVKLSPARGHALLTSSKDFIAFVDEGTKPCRSVVVKLPPDLDGRHLQQLLEVLERHALLTRDTDGVLTTVTSSVETAFNFTAQKSSGLLKEHAPGVAKTTKGFRKGAGNLVRLGGELMNKGASYVAEAVAPPTKEEKQVEFDGMVIQLRAAIASVRQQLEKGEVAYVAAPRG